MLKSMYFSIILIFCELLKESTIFKKFIYFCIFLTEIGMHILKRERSSFLSAGSLPKGPQQLGLGQAEPGARNSIRVSATGGEDPSTWVIFCCLPGCIRRKLDQKWRHGMSPHLHTGRGCHEQRLHVLCHNTCPGFQNKQTNKHRK